MTDKSNSVHAQWSNLKRYIMGQYQAHADALNVLGGLIDALYDEYSTEPLLTATDEEEISTAIDKVYEAATCLSCVVKRVGNR